MAATVIEPFPTSATKNPLDLLRTLPLDKLTDAKTNIELIPKLGLYPHEDWSRNEFPKALWPFCGHGIGLWQYPNQFGPYLATLAKISLVRPIRSYLEIGVAGGGTFITTMELLRRLVPTVCGFGIDPAPPGQVYWEQKEGKTPFANPTQAYFDTPAHQSTFLQGRSQERLSDASLPKIIDLVLVDGDHSYEAVRSDVLRVRDRTNILVLHDIVSDACPGVERCWNELVLELTQGVDPAWKAFTFTSQYEECRQRNQGKWFLGIGMLIRTKWL